MKKTLGLIGSLLLCITSVSAQEQSWEQRMNLKDSIYHLLNEYKLSSSFQDLARTGISSKKTEQFRNLFEKNARLINDIYPVYAKDKNKPQYPYQLAEADISSYIDTIKKVFPEGLRVNLRRANIDYSDLGRGKINIFIDREVRGKTVYGYQFQNRDTLVLTLNVQATGTAVKIAGIALAGKGSNLTCDVCDYDGDGVFDAQDQAPQDPCIPVGSPKRTKFFLSLSATGMLNRPEMAALQPSALGYQALVTDQTLLGDISHNLFPGVNLGLSAAVDYFFTRKLGISVGAGYTLMTFNLALDTFHVEYKLAEETGSTSSHRQLLTSQSIGEWIQAQYFFIPLLLKYHHNTAKKVSYFIHAGPSFSVLISGKSHAHSFIDYQAIHSSYTDGNRTDVLLTSEAAKPMGYNVALYERVSNVTTFKQKMGLFGNLKVGLLFKLTPNVSLLAGVSAAYGKITNHTKENYKLTDQIGEYTSVMAASDHVRVLSYGLTTGFSIGIGKKNPQTINCD
jgi:hypothetical protein